MGWLCFILLAWFGVLRLTSGFREVKLSGGDTLSQEKWDGMLRIGCYNIAHGRGGVMGGSNWEGGSKEERLERMREIAELIRGQDLDVLVLNEVDFNCTWSHGLNQAEYLAEACGFSEVVEQRNLDLGIPFMRVAIGNAILSHLPIESAEVVPYPAVKWWEPIVAGKKKGVEALVKLPDGSEVEVFAVHLETRDEEVRKASLQEILKKAGPRSILAGDFNSERRGDGSSSIDRALGDGAWQGGADQSPTFPSNQPKIRIDWILVPKAWREVFSKTFAAPLSDHALVVSEWRLN